MLDLFKNSPHVFYMRELHRSSWVLRDFCLSSANDVVRLSYIFINW